MGFVLICGLILSLAYAKTLTKHTNQIFATILTGTLLVGTILCASFAALIMLTTLLAVFALGLASKKKLAATLLVAIILITPKILLSGPGKNYMLTSPAQKAGYLLFGQPERKNKVYKNKVYHVTLGVRIETIEEGLRLWRQHPFFGAGLGVQLYKQQQSAKPETLVQIHNTPIWILADMGLFGFLSFAALFAIFISTLWRKSKSSTTFPNLDGSFPLAAMVILASLLVMSMAHELMYQRITWLILGMAIAYPTTQQTEENNTT